MDKRAAAQYLATIFGSRQGHVAVAYKHPTQKDNWKESQFAWPADKAKLLTWAEQHQNDNVFICPALRRDAHTRKKGDMRPSQWLWADVDWQSVPADKVQVVKDRIAELGTLTVRSGSGDNVHVYVQLTTDVDHETFIKLNTGLRDYLYADNKQADNSLLRLPGTTNWKTEKGSPVVSKGKTGRAKSPDSLRKNRVFRDARVIQDVDAQEWSFTEVEGLPRRVRAMVEMDVPQAEARYGNRHKAVWAITGELYKRGLGVDEIHSLMHKFPPAISKAADENGYDVHRDVDKRIAYSRATESLTVDEEHEIEAEAFELATDEDDLAEYQTEVERLAKAEMMRTEARKLARTMEDERTHSPIPIDASWDVTDLLKDPPAPAQYLIGVPPDGKRGLCGVKHNVVITAQYKTGKTKFVIATIARALAHGEDFMGDVPVHTPLGGVVVGHWNCEMDPDEIAAEYVTPAGIERNFKGVNLRGHRVNILTPSGKHEAVQWLRDRKIKVWTIDSLARLARMAGVSEKDNDEMFDLLMALDEIKVEAEVDVLFLITHTGRSVQEEGKERARGATAIDDWADARWILTEQDKIRFLAVDGRGVGLDPVALVYDEATGHSTRGMGGKADMKDDGQVQAIVRVVKEQPGITKIAIAKVMKLSQRAIAQYVDDAIEAGFIEMRADTSGRGRAAHRHYVVGMEKPEGDRRMNGTPREVVIPRAKTRMNRRT